jgi:hypothetical protein
MKIISPTEIFDIFLEIILLVYNQIPFKVFRMN